MQVYTHPETKTWFPFGGVAYPPPFPDQTELPKLILHDVIFKYPSGIEFVFLYPRGQFRSRKTFRDARFAKAIYRNKAQIVGLPFSMVGFVDISFEHLRLVNHLLFTER